MFTLEGEPTNCTTIGLKDLCSAANRYRAGRWLTFVGARESMISLEKVVDRFEDVANEINGIVIEHM